MSRPQELNVVPIALLQARLRREEKLAEASERRKREGNKPRVSWTWSRIRGLARVETP